jgi:MFS family permease
MPVQYSKAFRIANIVVGCFQNITSGGVLFGWASISGSMLLATPTDGGPGLSHDYIHIMFVTASFFSFLGPLLLGAILDSYGPRVCSVISMSFICCGCVLFALSNVPNFPMFIPALSMIAFGGPGVQSAIVHLCNLFPGNKGTATAFITGSFQLSFVIFLIFDQLWHFFEYDYQMLFMGYGFICLCNTLLSLCFWPDEPYTYEESVVDNVSEICCRSFSLQLTPPTLTPILILIALPGAIRRTNTITIQDDSHRYGVSYQESWHEHGSKNLSEQ